MGSAVATTIRDPIETHARDQLTPWIPLTFDGVTFEPEDDSGALREFWARLTILYGDAFESTMGDEGVGENVLVGAVVVDLFGPPGHGKGPLIEKADQVRDLFNRKTFDIGDTEIEFQPTSGPGEPRVDREGYLVVSLRTPFEVQEIY